MQQYPTIDREINRLIDRALLHTSVSRTVFRRAGVRLGATTQAGADVSGLFAAQDEDASTFTFAFTSGISAFPLSGRMTRDATGDLASEERLVVNVALAGPSGSELVAGDSGVAIDTEGLAVSEWIARSDYPLMWTINSPTSGTVEFGLLQRQIR